LPAPRLDTELLAELAPLHRTRRATAGTWLRWAVALSVVGAAVWAVFELTRGERLTEQQLHAWVSGFGAWGPVVFLLAFALLGSLIIPTTALTVLGAALFDSFGGFAYSLLGGLGAAMLGFSAARTLGRRSVMRFIARRGGRMAALDAHLGTRGFATAVFVRLLYLPNGLINVVSGVSAIPAHIYALATLVGMTPMVFAVAFMAGGAREALLAGDMGALLDPEVLLSALLFVICISIPIVYSMRQRRRRAAATHDAPTPEPERPL
jgi:uncharacterized membrane protein YdjX (TVP38/TMEM64 family)